MNDPLAAQMGLLVMRAEDMFNELETAGQQNKLDPPLGPAVAAAYVLKGYIAGSDAGPARAQNRPLRGTDR